VFISGTGPVPVANSVAVALADFERRQPAMKFAICNELFGDWTFERVCQFVRRTGYDGLEIAPYTLAPAIDAFSPEARADHARVARDAGIEITGLHWLLARTQGLHLTAPERNIRQHTAAYLIELGHACADLGGEVMVFGSPGQRSLLPGVSAEQAHAYAAEVFRAAMPAIADRGVRLCIEPLSAVETDFITSCAEGLELVRAVDHPAFQLHLDVKAMASESRPIVDLIRAHGAGAGHFHANDANLRGPGFGETDFVPILAALQASGYRGWVSVEVFDPWPDPPTVARESLAYLRNSAPLGPTGESEPG